MRAVLACLLLLTGCARSIEVQRVEVPVAVPCVERGSIPVEPGSKFDAVADTAPLDLHVQALLMDREAGRSYSRRLRALIEGCVSDGR